MPLIDFILNLAALLLFLSWRSLHFDPLVQATPVTLAGTLRRAEPRPVKSWHLWTGLGLLLVSRAGLYWFIGGPAEWVPKLDLGVVVLAFRSDRLWVELLFSFLSFLRLLLVFCFWLLTLAALNRQNDEPAVVQRALRLQVGRLVRWPWSVQILIPLLAAAGVWVALHPLLAYAGVADRARSWLHLLEQAGLVTLCLFCTLKFLLPPIFFLHLISSYVFLGRNPLWEFVSVTARSALRPLAWVRLGRIDLAPVAGVVLVFLMLHWLPNLIFGEMARRHLTLWPQ